MGKAWVLPLEKWQQFPQFKEGAKRSAKDDAFKEANRKDNWRRVDVDDTLSVMQKYYSIPRRPGESELVGK
jgi:hypothetical protein